MGCVALGHLIRDGSTIVVLSLHQLGLLRLLQIVPDSRIMQLSIRDHNDTFVRRSFEACSI